eukprot:1891119-Karenia_brevis.AAC.1
MKIKEWPNPSNVPVLNVHVDHHCRANKHGEAPAPPGGVVRELVLAPRPQPVVDVLDPTHL